MKGIITIKFIIQAFCLASLYSCNTKIENSKTESYKVWGNCSMCKKTIEKAVASNGNAIGNWNKDAKMITLKYDSTKTNSNEILKRIADIGYDNDKFIAPDQAYNKRPKCCRYKRKIKN